MGPEGGVAAGRSVGEPLLGLLGWLKWRDRDEGPTQRVRGNHRDAEAPRD